MTARACLPIYLSLRMVCCLLLLLGLLRVQSQTAMPAKTPVGSFDATDLRQPTDLAGTWLVRAGDNPAYARPDFDDSHWTPFDPHTSIIPLFPNSEPEIVWYRQRIRVDPSQAGLALREQSIAHAYEIYVNGERLFASGQVAPYRAYTVGGLVLKSIPERLVASGSLVIALRVHISPDEWGSDLEWGNSLRSWSKTTQSFPGLFATNLTVGSEEALDRNDWLTVIGDNFSNWLILWLFMCVGMVALVLYAAQPRQTEYLWLFSLGMVALLDFIVGAICSLHEIPVAWQILDGALHIATPFFWAAMYFAFVRQRIGWRFSVFLVFTGILNTCSWLEGPLLPTLPANFNLLASLPLTILFAIAIPLVLVVHLRRGNREAGILLIPVILVSLNHYFYGIVALLAQFPSLRPMAARGEDLMSNNSAGPFLYGPWSISDLLSTVSLAVIILLRFTRMSRHESMLEGELAAAREVQQVILPEQMETIPGFSIESAYEPAQQVGGDFFQIIPTGEGGLVLVLGDVAGKGLPAAMLVSVMVGAIRATAEYTHAPEELLASLNERLIGRSRGGFSTALAAHFSSEGVVTIANAGHLSPYMDGRELELPGALPLGILSGERYAATRFALEPGSRLTFYSDGVVEAQNAAGELLGFERSRELSTQPASEIVQAAKEFGQSDDITVVAIRRTQAARAAA